MSSVQFNFPPESYSVVYTADGTPNANVVGKCNLSESCEVSGSPPGLVHTPPSSLFSCFHCAFQNGINFTRKKQRRKENHTANHKVYLLTNMHNSLVNFLADSIIHKDLTCKDHIHECMINNIIGDV